MAKSLLNLLRNAVLFLGITAIGANLIGCSYPISYQEQPTKSPITGTENPGSSIPTSTPTNQPTSQYKTISGFLQDNETDTNKPGEVRLYIDDVLSQTDSDGNDFSFSVPYGSNVKLKGMIKDGETQTSYVRTKDLGTITDNVSLNLRAVPYPDFNNDGVPDYIEEFKTQHMIPTNCPFSKWNLNNNLYKIKIFKHNGNSGDFTDAQIILLVNTITDDNSVEKFAAGKQLDSLIEIIDGSPTQSYENNCIFVVPDFTPCGNGGAAGWAGVSRDSSRTIYAGRIEFDPDCVGNNLHLIGHEFGHIFVAPDGHSRLPDELTILNQYDFVDDMYSANPLPADEKAIQLVYEDTYKPGERYYDTVLGMNF